MIETISVLASFFLSALLVFAVLRIAKKWYWFDKPDERKIHDGEVPRLGGVGFALAFILVAGWVTLLDPSGESTSSFGLRFLPVLIAMPLVLAFGIVDDFKSLRPLFKLMAQIVAAFLVTGAGFTFHRFSFPAVGIDVTFGFWRYPLTFIWIVGMTNAVNLIDGVDGLAGGVSAIIALTYAAIFWTQGNQSAAILCVTLAASIGGFLVFNLPLPKAKIFMGDGGSQFLGFMLALLPLLDNGQGRASVPLPYAAALSLIPILDTFSAIWRRVRDGRPIDSPDKAHMHHKLIKLGCTVPLVDACAWSLQIVLGVLVLVSLRRAGTVGILLLLAAYALGTTFFIAIHFANRAVNLRRSAT